MATRPIYIPVVRTENAKVNVENIDFKWHAGMAPIQKQKSIESLHEAALALGYEKLLEISSKSKIELGRKLSAFDLAIKTRKGKVFTVECAFQSSKVFELGGPYIELLNGSSLDAKRDVRLKESGNLTSFQFFDTSFPLVPKTYFYDWLYISALHQNSHLAQELVSYSGFTDIEFNPKKSVNCQAYSAALYVSLFLSNEKSLDEIQKSPELFLELMREEYSVKAQELSVQGTLI